MKPTIFSELSYPPPSPQWTLAGGYMFILAEFLINVKNSTKIRHAPIRVFNQKWIYSSMPVFF